MMSWMPCRLQDGIQTPSIFMCWPADHRSCQRPVLARRAMASNRPMVSVPCSTHKMFHAVRTRCLAWTGGCREWHCISAPGFGH